MHVLSVCVPVVHVKLYSRLFSLFPRPLFPVFPPACPSARTHVLLECSGSGRSPSSVSRLSSLLVACWLVRASWPILHAKCHVCHCVSFFVRVPRGRSVRVPHVLVCLGQCCGAVGLDLGVPEHEAGRAAPWYCWAGGCEGRLVSGASGASFSRCFPLVNAFQCC
jgi:hypothetical protein